MKQIIFSIVAVAVVVAFQACDSTCISGTGSVVTEELDLAPIHGINSSGSHDVYIDHGSEQVVLARGEKNIIDRVKRNVGAGIWDANLINGCYRSYQLELDVTVPVMDYIETNGSGNVIVGSSFDSLQSLEIYSTGSGNLSQDGFFSMEGHATLRNTGSGSLKAGVHSASLSVTSTGSGYIQLEGSTSHQSVRMDGSGNYTATQLESDTCLVDISGSGNAQVWANDVLDVVISGSGNVYYRGNPFINATITGSGRLIDAN